MLVDLQKYGGGRPFTRENQRKRQRPNADTSRSIGGYEFTWNNPQTIVKIERSQPMAKGKSNHDCNGSMSQYEIHVVSSISGKAD